MTIGKLPPGWMDIDFGHARPGLQGGAVKALMSARAGGASAAPYELCNLGDHVQDDPQAVAHNRAAFARHLAGGAAGAVEVVWMTQVHGNRIVRLTRAQPGPAAPDAAECFNPTVSPSQPVADGALTTEAGLACTVMVADCLPVLLAAPDGKGVAALHAGWRGLAGAGDMAGHGVVHAGVKALCEATGADPADLHAWLGPCIGPAHFEVGADVLVGFGVDPQAGFDPPRFVRLAGRGAAADMPSSPAASQAKWLADLPGLARDTLHAVGVQHITGGTWCTVSEPSRFFSFRRDRVTGRQAAGICLLPQ